ncbi:MAG: DMT family transporter [Peptococcaceae bacterium]|nr:DMT family transporter [Peptococcaceae bacterium]
MKKSSSSFWPRAALFSASLIWGSSFVAMKDAVGVFPVNMLLAFRFGISFLLFCIIFLRRLKTITTDYLRKTALIGFFLYAAYIMQTFGLKGTTPGKNAFLTAAYVILVPFIHWLAGKRKPAARNLIAALICLVGVGLISFVSPGDAGAIERLSIGIGDGFTLGGAFFFAAHIVLLGLFTKDKDPVLITLLQFGFCALYFSLTSFFFEAPPGPVAISGWLNLLYLALLCTSLAMLFQNYGQKHVSPASAAIIMSLEAVFGVMFSVLLYGDTLTPRLVLGFALVFAAILVSEVQIKHKKTATEG